MIIEVKVVTNAKKRDVVREGSGLKIKLTALPRDNKANEELIGYLSHIFGVKRTEIKIVRGEKDRRKLLSIPVDEATLNSIIRQP